MKTKTCYRIFIQEDDRAEQKRIAEEFKDYNCVLRFFPTSYSSFDLLNFSPDILIQDFRAQKAIKCYEWSVPYNQL